jgi:hypothetical protein
MSEEAKLIVILIGIAVFQITWHWLLTLPNGVSETCLRIYLQQNEHSRKGVAGILDMVLPAAVLGMLMGLMTPSWKVGKLMFTAFIGDICLTSLMVAYARIIGKSTAWWWAANKSDANLLMAGNFGMNFVVLIICALGMRESRRT